MNSSSKKIDYSKYPSSESEDDGGLEKKKGGKVGVPPPAPAPAPAPGDQPDAKPNGDQPDARLAKPKMGRPVIQNVERDIHGRIKRPRPPPSEKQLENLRVAREKRREMVAERQRIAAEAKQQMAKVGVTKARLQALELEKEEAKKEAAALKEQLEQHKKQSSAVEPPATTTSLPNGEKRPASPNKDTKPAKKSRKQPDSSSSSESETSESEDDYAGHPFYNRRPSVVYY